MRPPYLLIMALVVISASWLGQGCGEAEEDAVPASARSLANSAEVGLAAVVGLGAPLSGEAVKIFKEQSTLGDAAAKKQLASALGADVVKSSACFTINWSGLTANINFKSCTLRATGEVIDGGCILALKIKPKTQLAATFNHLKIGGRELNGSIKVDIGGGFKPVLTSNVAFTTDGGAAAVTTQALSVSFSSTSTVVNGQLNAESAQYDSVLTAKELTWKPGQCLPSSGTLTYQEGGESIVLTFLSSTPATGEVSLQVGALPPVTAALLTPC